jgi:probable rRNA maturation factor
MACAGWYMILIKNRQRKIVIEIERLKQDIQRILDHLQYTDFDIGVLLTTNATIRTYNQQYRDKDKPTDILSFPYHATLKAGKRIQAKTEDDKNLGDLIISLEYVKKDAQKKGETFEDRFTMLLVHGICHLLGYDHSEDVEYEQMQKKETELLDILASNH